MPFREVSQKEIDDSIKDLIAKHPEYKKKHDDFMKEVAKKVLKINESTYQKESKE